MNTKKPFGYLAVIILGSIITAVIDNLIGVDFRKMDLGLGTEVIHNVMYMLWGGCIFMLDEWF